MIIEKKPFFYLFFSITLFFISSSCKIYWKENKQNYLLTNINIKKKEIENIKKENLTLKQQKSLKNQNFERAIYPFLNKKIFGIRFYLALYEWGDHPGLEAEIARKKAKLEIKDGIKRAKYEIKKTKWEERKHKQNLRLDKRDFDTIAPIYKPYQPKKYTPTFKEWLTTVVGEAPVFVDSSQIEEGVKKLSDFLFTHGFFKHKVDYQLDYFPKKQKATLTYHIKAMPAFFTNKISYNIKDTNILNIFKKNEKKSFIKNKKQFSFDDLENEQKRLYQLLKNKGYHTINLNNIGFLADTNNLDYTVDLQINIEPNVFYATYRYGKINLFIDIPKEKKEEALQKKQKNYTFYYLPKNPKKPKKLPYKTDYLIRNLRQIEGEIVEEEKIKNAQNRLSNYGETSVFRYTEFNFSPQEDQHLNVDWRLVSSKKNSLLTNFNATVRGQNLGAGFLLGLSYKNIFKGAERLYFQFMGGVEAQPLVEEYAAGKKKQFRYVPNSYQINPQIGLQIPQVLFPFSGFLLRNSLWAKTDIIYAYDFLARPDFLRTNQKIYFRYEWNSGNFPFITHQISLFELTYSRYFNKSKGFLERINKLKDRYLFSLFQDYFIPLSSYFLKIEKGNLTQEKTSSFKNYFLLEASGNILRKLGENWNLKTDDQSGYQIAGVTFAQYLKMQNDFRYYYNINQKSSFALRFLTGVIQPMKNSQVVPFEKSFFVGGNNDLRGWKNYALGPGSSFDTIQNYDKVGDIKLLLSAEYRFNVISYLDMAVFADAGNIWLMNKNQNYPNGEFEWKRFYKEIAFSAGIGLRLNFNNYFIFVFDVAYPLYEPSFFENEKWIWQSKKKYNEATTQYNQNNQLTGDKKLGNYNYIPSFNIGIGYPF